MCIRDRYLRLAAEYDNYRKRTTKEKENVYADAKADTVKEFLGVLDNLERGLAQFAEGDPHRQGMELICRQFLAVLEKLGVTRIEAQGPVSYTHLDVYKRQTWHGSGSRPDAWGRWRRR